MRTVLIASLRTHTRRYVAALVAVTIAVGFVVVTNALASAAKSGLSAGVDQAYRGADLVVGEEYGLADEGDLQNVLDVVHRHPGDTATVVASGWLPVSHDGQTFGQETTVGTVALRPATVTQHILRGVAPDTPNEALVDASAAESAGVQIGDELVLGSGDDRTRVTVVGTAAGQSYLSATVYVPWETLASQPGAIVDAVLYSVAPEDDAVARGEELAHSVASAVSSRADYVDQRVTMVNQGIDVVSYVLLLFAGVAGFVAVLVIANTFTILFAQRTRDFALLRCVGATRRQVVRSVRVESVVLALVAASAGVVGGAAVGYGIAALVRVFAGAERVGTVSLSTTWLVAAFIGGVVTTVGAAWWPTRSVTRVSPLAALRPQEDPTVGARSGRLRVGLGVLIGGVGVGLLALAMASQSMPPLLAGGMASFVGVLLLGPVVVPAMLRAAGRLLGRSGPATRIAAANAVRNPRRSAATTASLLVGVTLTAAVLTGMASARGALDTEMNRQHPVDAALVGTGEVQAAVVEDVAATRGVERTVTVDGVVASVGDLDDVPVLAPSDDARAVTRDQAAVTAGRDEILVPLQVAARAETGLPERVEVNAAGATVSLRLRLVGSEWGEAVVVAPTTLQQLGGGTALGVWAQVADGADADEIGQALGAAVRGSGLEVTNAVSDRAWVQAQLDVLVWAVLGLLGVGVLIALVGIANTVGLSVLERGREHALLRALGLTRRQLRHVLAAEGVLLALVAAVLGTTLGVIYGWLGVKTVVTTAVPDAPLVVPWAELLGVVLVAGLAGLAACVVPARRAARVAPAEGLTLD